MIGFEAKSTLAHLFTRVGAIVAVFLCALGTVLGAAVTATVDRPTIQIGETVTLSIAVEGANVGQPALPAIPNFQVVGTGSSFSFDSTRGTQQTFTYQLAPAQPGDFTIPALQFNIGGQLTTTQPLKVKVVPLGQAVTPPGATAPMAFVRLVMPKAQLYVGEVSEVQVQVFFQEGGIRQFPQLAGDAGFTMGKWQKPGEPTRVSFSNQIYGLYVFKQPVTPVKAGAMTLGPATVSLLVPDRTRPANFFLGRPEREVRLASEKLMIQVLPIPSENMPPTFAGAVGNFTLAVSAAPTNVAAGDPITVRVQIRGNGALDAIRLPPQTEWNEFKTYPPTSQVESADANNTSGTRTFEQAVVPERAGINALPPFVFSFFDPAQRTFRTLTGPIIPLTVAAGSGVASALPSLPGGTNAAPAQAVSDLAHIKAYLGTIAPQPLLLAQPWFLGLQLVPPAIWLGLLLNRKRRERLARDPKLLRRHEVSRKVRRGLSELRAQAGANNSEAFFATMLRLLQEQIGERVDLPANAITEAVIDERLRPMRAPDTICTALHELFQMCNLARYAPVKSSGELSAIVPRVEQALRELQRWEPA